MEKILKHGCKISNEAAATAALVECNFSPCSVLWVVLQFTIHDEIVQPNGKVGDFAKKSQIESVLICASLIFNCI